MSASTSYSPDLRERAVRMVIDNREDYPSEWAAMTAISRGTNLEKSLNSPTNTLREENNFLADPSGLASLTGDTNSGNGS